MTAAEAGELAEIEREERLFILHVTRYFERLKDHSAQRLGALMQDGDGRRGEVERWWDCLTEAERELCWWTAAYYLMSFGRAMDRFSFVFCPERREEMIDRILLAGGFLDGESRVIECPL